MDCIFCKIIKGDIPSYKIYENEYVYAFLDISQDTYGHTLVIPKVHSKNILDTDDKILSEVIKAVKLISNHYINDCGFDGVNIINANNECAEQSVNHLHFHIIPRKNNDGKKVFPKFNNKETTSLEEQLKILKM
jgi:histidine triad (HIT) family protein